MKSEENPIERLKNGPRYPFTESPRKHIGEEVRSGVYTIWRGEELIYAGFAGRDGAKGGFVNRWFIIKGVTGLVTSSASTCSTATSCRS
jgi:hypothetical protein